MMKQATEATEKMSAVAAALKEERWGDAERSLHELRTMLDAIRHAVRMKVRGTLSAPEPDAQDRG